MRSDNLLSSEAAAKALGVSEDLFEDLIGEFGDWMRPVYLGRGDRKLKKWKRKDVLCVLHIINNRMPDPPAKGAKKNPGEG